MKVNTEKQYYYKPKRRKGYTLDVTYCECGCKTAFWNYRKIECKNKQYSLNKTEILELYLCFLLEYKIDKQLYSKALKDAIRASVPAVIIAIEKQLIK